MTETDDDIKAIREYVPTPRYPTGPIMLSQRAVSLLGEEIGVAAMQVTDFDGLKISVVGDMGELSALAAKVVGEWLKTTVIVEGSGDLYADKSLRPGLNRPTEDAANV